MITITRNDFTLDTVDASIPYATFSPQSPTAALLYLHGGGWALGDIDDVAEICASLAQKANCRIYVPAYRLTPNHPYPAANHDCLAMWHMMTTCEMTPCFIGGDSSGGHLALTTALKTHRFPTGIALIYPVTTLSPDTTSPSWVGYERKWPLSPRLMHYFINEYIPENARHAPGISPLESDCTALPPTLIISAGKDILLDQQTAYANHTGAEQIILSDAHHIFLARPEGETYTPITLDHITRFISNQIKHKTTTLHINEAP